MRLAFRPEMLSTSSWVRVRVLAPRSVVAAKVSMAMALIMRETGPGWSRSVGPHRVGLLAGTFVDRSHLDLGLGSGAPPKGHA